MLPLIKSGLLFLLPFALAMANPPKGIPVPEAIRTKLEAELSQLEGNLDGLRSELANQPRLLTLIPDVEIYYNAVSYALVHDQFYQEKSPSDFETARLLLKQGGSRAAALRDGQAPWTRQTGLVVRGYVSKIDGSTQPYGLEIPDDYDFDKTEPGRLDIWYHGRNNNLSELAFLKERETKPGKFHSPDTIVLHPYGRYCNANKFAGEVDTFEAVDSVSERYPIDPDRIAVRGFSMGGGATWHMATHHAGRWAAAAPGAGFAETAVYANVMSKDPPPTWYEKTLFQLYDAIEYAANLYHCPTIAYSGSEDKQKQAADIMTEYLRREGLELPHVIGQGMGHKYDDSSIQKISSQMDQWLSQPKDRYPKNLRFTTRSLRYNAMLWLTVDALDAHWKRSDVKADIVDAKRIEIETRNIRGFSLDFPEHANPFAKRGTVQAVIDGQSLALPASIGKGDVALSFRKQDHGWSLTDAKAESPFEKSPGLQGPIDDAFMDSFLFVLPSGKASSSEFEKWVKSEAGDAQLQWWRQFRGQARVKRDTEVTEEDIQSSNLILWGDPASNRLIARIQDRLPIKWQGVDFELNEKRYSSRDAVPVIIYPNPLNPKRYVVLNSGFTFAAFASGSNSLQVPKLPDWGVIDLATPRESRHPRGVLDAGFFDESWQFKSAP